MDWRHQTTGVRDVLGAIEDGTRMIVLTSPTGGGKSRMVCNLIDAGLDREWRSVLYTNRRMLTEQTVKVLARHGITHGVRAAGWEDYGGEHGAVQIASLPTEHARSMKRMTSSLHDAQLVIVDEAHMQKGRMADGILREHLAAGASVVLVTATPIELGFVAGIEPTLIVAGTNSELRKCGALVPAMHYGPDEPDTHKIKKQPWEMTEGDVRKVVMVQGIFGRVLAEFNRLNPDRRPTILFAPGVKESLWFAQQLSNAGIKAAHIDGKDCWIDGEFHASEREIREQILDGSRSGEIKVICNRFVLREGIDAPWLAHGIFATIFGSLQSYLQSGGRLLRAFPGLESVTIQDHGGNWHRHGSLNADRVWNLAWTEGMIQGQRQERLRAKQEPEPFLCPQCKKVLTRSECSCGFKVGRHVRPVVQHDGTIKEHEGDIYRPRVVREKSDTLQKWERVYFRAKNSKRGMTFRQARGLFFYEEHYYPPDNLPYMPVEPLDWYRPCAEVPKERLHGYGQRNSA